MEREPEGKAGGRAPRGAGKPTREERLKAALKANMARRKAQARAKGERFQDQTDGAVRDGGNETE